MATQSAIHSLVFVPKLSVKYSISFRWIRICWAHRFWSVLTASIFAVHRLDGASHRRCKCCKDLRATVVAVAVMWTGASIILRVLSHSFCQCYWYWFRKNQFKFRCSLYANHKYFSAKLTNILSYATQTFIDVQVVTIVVLRNWYVSSKHSRTSFIKIMFLRPFPSGRNLRCYWPPIHNNQTSRMQSSTIVASCTTLFDTRYALADVFFEYICFARK